MRFGLADLDELPSLKEFEQLAQAALGADDGIAPMEPESASIESPAGSPDENAPRMSAASEEPFAEPPGESLPPASAAPTQADASSESTTPDAKAATSSS